MASAETTTGRPVIQKLRALGVDVAQLADEPLPDELWEVIANVIRAIWSKQGRWYAAAAMYGRFVTALNSGVTAAELSGQFGGGQALAILLQQAEMRELILGANLPGTFNLWLADVMRRMRLTRQEKLTIASELIEQFRAGLAEGQSAAEITARLGEPRATAHRLRREKLKQRPWWWRAFRTSCRVAAVVTLLLTVAIIGLQYRYYNVHPVDSGDEVERLDARAQAIPVADRAWPFYAAGLAEIVMLPHELPQSQPLNPQQQQQRQQLAAEIRAACEAGPDHAAWTEAAAYIAENRAAVGLFLQAAAKPRLGFIRRDPVNNGWLKKLNQGTVDQIYQHRPRHGLVLPEIAAFHHARHLLAGSAFEAAAAGDQSRAIECLDALAGLAQHIWQEDEFPVGRMTALSVFDTASQTLKILLSKYGDAWSEHDLLRCLAILRSWDLQADDLLTTSRQWLRQTLRETYSADGRYTRESFEDLCQQPLKAPELAWLENLIRTTAITPSGMTNRLGMALVGPCVVPFVAGREELLSEFDALTELYAAELQLLPTGASGPGAADKKSQQWLQSKSTQIRYLPLLLSERSAWMMGAIEGRWRKVAERDGVILAVACQIYRRRHGAWPDSVSSLVPEVLDAAPIDPIDGQPLRLVIINDRPVIYSVGLDGKDATANVAEKKLKEIDPRDWQLYPALDPTAGAEPAK